MELNFSLIDAKDYPVVYTDEYDSGDINDQDNLIIACATLEYLSELDKLQSRIKNKYEGADTGTALIYSLRAGAINYDDVDEMPDIDLADKIELAGNFDHLYYT